MTFHADVDTLHQYGTDPGRLDPRTAMTLEEHLLGCASCRAEVAAAARGADGARLAMLWDGVADAVDAPRVGFVERWLCRLGVSPTSARLVSATRPLQVAWLAGLLGVVGGIVVMARTAGSDGPLLVVAPVLPLIAVVVAFAPGSDPAGEAGGAAPMSGFRLVLERAVAVLGASMGMIAIGALIVPGVGVGHAAWVLPALGLSIGSLALATWIRVEHAASALALGWTTALAVSWYRSSGEVAAIDLAPLTPAGQAIFAAMAAIGFAVIFVRRTHFESIGRTA